MGTLDEESFIEVESPFGQNEFVGDPLPLSSASVQSRNSTAASKNHQAVVSRPILRASRSNQPRPDGSVDYTPPHPSEIIPLPTAPIATPRRPPQRVNSTDFRRSTRRSLNAGLPNNNATASNMAQHSPARRGRTSGPPPAVEPTTPINNAHAIPMPSQIHNQMNVWSLSGQPVFGSNFTPFANGIQTPMGWNANLLSTNNNLSAPVTHPPPMPAPAHSQSILRAPVPSRAHGTNLNSDILQQTNSVRPMSTIRPRGAQARRNVAPQPSMATMMDACHFIPQAAPVNTAVDDFFQQMRSLPGIDVDEIIKQLSCNPGLVSLDNRQAVEASQIMQNIDFLTETIRNQRNQNLTSKQPPAQLPRPPPPAPLPTEDDMARQDLEADADQDEEFHEVETYSDYIPAKLTIGCKHPDPVVETSSLSSVEPPDVIYNLKLPAKVIDNGLLSALQLESVIYASQQHNLLLPDGTRKGFLIGDGAGVGKGRTIAGIIYENYLCGRKKSIWLSVSTDLKFDAERDLKDIGAKIPVFFLSKFPYGRRINEDHGVIFTTYSGLISKSHSVKGVLGTRIGQLTSWLGNDFDGIIVFDECHKAKNISTSAKTKTHSKAAEFAVEIQNKLPKARIVYASATGASETRHLGYMTRLGIWGKGTPYKTFADFCTSIDKRGVGGMEMVAVELKMRGSYIARQLSFKTTTFHVRIATLNEEFVKLYDDCVDLWAKALESFSTATALVEEKTGKNCRTIWTSFWAAHQKFFKYLCIGAKVPLVVEIAEDALANDKCVVIGLQSTGEAKTMEALEDGDINEFVSTARATFESLVENHFPGPKTQRRSRLGSSRHTDHGDKTDSSSSGTCAVSESSGSTVDESWHGHDVVKFVVEDGKVKAQLEEEKVSSKLKRNSKDLAPRKYSKNENVLRELAAEKRKEKNMASGRALRAKRRAAARGGVHKSRIRVLKDDSEDTDISNPSSESLPTTSSSPLTENMDSDTDYEETESDGDSSTLIDSSSTEEEEVAEIKHQPKLSPKKSDSKKVVISEDSDDSDIMITAVKPKKHPVVVILSSDDEDELDELDEEANSAESFKKEYPKLIALKKELFDMLDKLSPRLPHNTLDDLIDRLGGPDKVAEMTGRKGRIVKDSLGKISYKCRNEADALDNLNIAEKERFMNGDKLIAIISEAASSGISLQADRRVANTKRRVHITIELPWSADRAIQQFGRTHRSNQLSGPEYVFVISELAGEKRFASIVAKRLESLGALTHGDRRATTETRDLSQFNIASKYCRQALELLYRYIDSEIEFANIKPDYPGSNFIKDARKAFVGAGLGTHNVRYFSIDGPTAHNINNFLNRLLGMKVAIQNALFRLFTDYMDRLIMRKKVTGQYDAGILELNSETGKARCGEPEMFRLKTQSGYVACALRYVQVERGVSWEEAMKLLEDGPSDSRSGFYISTNPLTKVQLVFMVIREPISVDLFRSYKPNTGKAPKSENISFLVEKARKCTPAAAEKIWRKVFEVTHIQCVHMCYFNSCKRIEAKMKCDVGMRHRNYCILSGGILTAWPLLERSLGAWRDGTKRFQIVRLKIDSSNRVIGKLQLRFLSTKMFRKR